MSEDLRSLLQRADRPHSPSQAELDRIRTRVLDHPAPELAELITLQPERQHPPTRRRWVATLAAGLALFALVGVAAQLRGDDKADVAVVPPLSPVCEAVRNVDLALESWRTIDDWARLATTNPDLASETATVLELLSPPEVVIAAELDRSLLALQQASRPGREGQRTDTRKSAVEEAMRVAIVELEATSAGCDLELWTAALE